MILETERLYLRVFESKDLDVLAGIYSSTEVMRFIGTGVTFTRTQTENSIKSWIAYETKHGFSNWALIRKQDNILIGKCGLSWLPDNSDVEVSYILGEPCWGMGYATEIAKAVIKYGFDNCKLNRITALVYPQNIPSIHVLEKAGMRFEKEAEYWDNKLLLFSITKP